MRLLGLDASAVGQPAAEVFGREDLQPFGALLRAVATGKTEPSAQEIALTRDERELQLAAVATALPGGEGSDGMVLVLDDVTPLIRAQKVAAWREVARRLAHEIKNPLTPIQLCAERMRRHFSRRTGRDAGAGRGVHVDDRRRSRFAEGAGGRVLAVRADAGAARGVRPTSTRWSTTRWRSIRGCWARCGSSGGSRSSCRRCGWTASRYAASSSTSSTTRSRR